MAADMDPRALRAEQLLGASRLLDPATASRADLARVIGELQHATGLALDAHAALLGPPADASADATRDADASGDPLLAEARRIDAEHRAKHHRPAPLRRLQSQLRIGQPRAQQLQRALTAPETEG